MLDTVEKTFLFTFKTKQLLSKLTVPVQIPLDISTQEFVGRLVHAHNLPCFVEEGKLIIFFIHAFNTSSIHLHNI